MAEIVSPTLNNTTTGSNGGPTYINTASGVQIIPSHHRHLLLGAVGGSSAAGSHSGTPSPPGTPRGAGGSGEQLEAAAHAAFGNATTITNNHNNNMIVINNNAVGPTAGCFVNSGTAVFYNGSAERLVRDWGADSIDDVNAATAMLALKHGPKVFADGYHTGGGGGATATVAE